MSNTSEGCSIAEALALPPVSRQERDKFCPSADFVFIITWKCRDSKHEMNGTFSEEPQQCIPYYFITLLLSLTWHAHILRQLFPCILHLFLLGSFCV